MKAFADFLPVLLFFAVYWATRDMFLATGAAIAASVVFTAYAWFRHRKVETMQWVSLALIVALGGATILFHDKHFIMWKPTALYWLIAAGLVVGELSGKNGIRALLGKQVELPDAVWRQLNRAWTGFFALMGALNLWVAYSFSEAVWVNFKLFGGIGLMLVFAIGQSFYLSKYLEERN